MKPTPGPWTVKPNYSSDCEYSIYDKDGNFTGDTHPDRMDANARLISAAPDLLEAAKALSNLETTHPDFGAARRRLDAAIRKAEGRSK